MLIAMTFNIGLIVVAVTTLSAGQFAIELLDSPSPRIPDHENIKEPLLRSSTDDRTAVESYPLPARPRSRSKPQAIFIHPNESNIARADAVAEQLRLTSSPDSADDDMYPVQGGGWHPGHGRDAARELLGHC
ncbi:hypothetical protein A0H81_01362 [Grifola frondosa]|uniref:Secreted protein n=1 Tax=Grifola frondosa TaxID=5627 RepID=A0A1C7MS09_GRIFR|nr:hypothetical protein A0H81_01362 [Grifola frondosa]